MSGAKAGALRIEKLDRTHIVAEFDCGKEPLNRFLDRHALQSQQAGAANSYVALDGDRVVGFYSLVVGEVAYDDAAERLTKGMPRHPVPVMLLARLAIAMDYQGKGLGAGLLKDAMLRTLQAADLAGIRAIVVHAKDDDAKDFYERYGFEPSLTDSYHLSLLLKDVRRTLS
ncbi:GNAT family N-acetyltransferase [Sphingomonas colocasiae]|uniref:GNAT family N-acetyltransferase n=1 Tax=Sphingomonas colocasiae TaxID=1848973 RepID=A0ABS7PIK6_9SPHN|nr:GNAT family N-acetyltransferase [Sphingomonas colocasiae]MBY8821053.1 GNAT family N-acetyltransferase [Sphingomonas colocasiae]